MAEMTHRERWQTTTTPSGRLLRSRPSSKYEAAQHAPSKGEMEHTIVFHDLVIGGSAQRLGPRPRQRSANILPVNLPPLGGTLEQVAVYVGISGTSTWSLYGVV